MKNTPYQRQVFLLIVIFRWVSLIPAITLLISPEGGNELLYSPWLVFAFVLGVNLVITLFNRSLNRLLLRYPYILMIDMIFIAAVIYASAGVNSPYYLYALSPLMVGAFFFQLWGGLISAGIFTPMYLGAVWLANSINQVGASLAVLSTQLVGIWVITIAFSYLSLLIHRTRVALDELHDAQIALQRQNANLSATHDRLKSIYDLTVMLQAAPEVKSVQQQVLMAITRAFGFSSGILGLVDVDLNLIDGWESVVGDMEDSNTNIHDHKHRFSTQGTFPAVYLKDDGNIFSQALQSGQLFWISADDITQISKPLSNWVGDGTAMVMPLIFHEKPVGLLLAHAAGGKHDYSDDQLTMLRILSNQASTALGTTMLCVERAQDLAVEQERNRIARDIHDTVSQSLFGIVFSLDACIQMLPVEPLKVKKELVALKDLASQTRDQIRHSIFDLWPSSLTMDVFQSDLNHFVKACVSLNPFNIEYGIEGIFENLSPAIRRNLYRVTQEALSNVVHHAGVDSAQVCLEIDDKWVNLEIADQGRGFDTKAALSRQRNRERFGLHGMRERIQNLGGSFDIQSEPGHGTHVFIRVPVEA